MLASLQHLFVPSYLTVLYAFLSGGLQLASDWGLLS